MNKSFILKQQRNDLGLTQIELAKQLEISNNTVARWENGRLPISRIVELAMQQLISNRVKDKVESTAGASVPPPTKKPKQTASDNKNLLPSADKKREKKFAPTLPELPNGDKWLRASEIAERLGKPSSTIRDYCNKRGLAHTRRGMVNFIKESDLNTFLANRTARGKV
jgi:transcriptional regulator with XRE-family HTH domain